MQIVLVRLQTFHRNSRLKCALQPKIAKKFTKTPLLEVQGRSINVEKSKKPVTSSCYDKQHVCTYLQHQMSQ